eukprot:7510694-Ditylum_brightwellii.AAC.1
MKVTPLQSMNMIIRKDKTNTKLAAYLHACAFSPPLSTLQAAIMKGNFLTWPGIDTINFEKLITDTAAMEKGH